MLCDKIKDLREKNGMTQDEFANVLFVTRGAVSKWENGRSYPGIDSLKLISETFHVSIDELLSDEKIRNAYSLENEKVNASFMRFFIVLITLVSAFLFDFVKDWMFYGQITSAIKNNFILHGTIPLSTWLVIPCGLFVYWMLLKFRLISSFSDEKYFANQKQKKILAVVTIVILAAAVIAVFLASSNYMYDFHDLHFC